MSDVDAVVNTVERRIDNRGGAGSVAAMLAEPESIALQSELEFSPPTMVSLLSSCTLRVLAKRDASCQALSTILRTSQLPLYATNDAVGRR
jgi:hypothetical protein